MSDWSTRLYRVTVKPCVDCGADVERHFPRLPKRCARCAKTMRRVWRQPCDARYNRMRYDRYRKNGCCVWCGVPCPMNPITEKPFSLCWDHRKRQAQRWHAKKRKAA